MAPPSPRSRLASIRTLALALCVPLASAAAPAGAPCVGRTAAWCWQHVPVTGNPINDVWFLDARHGWAVGDAGTVLRSDDGGAHWQAQDSGVTRDLDQVRFVDADHGWALSRSSDADLDIGQARPRSGDADTGFDPADPDIVLRTVDGGAHWQSAAAPGLLRASLQVSPGGVVMVSGLWPERTDPQALAQHVTVHPMAVVSLDAGEHFRARVVGLFVLSPRSGDCWRLGHGLQRWPGCRQERSADIAPQPDADYETLASEDGVHAMATSRNAKLDLTAWRTDDAGAHWSTFTPPVIPQRHRELPLSLVADGHAWSFHDTTDDAGLHWRTVRNDQPWRPLDKVGSQQVSNSGVLLSGVTTTAWNTDAKAVTFTFDAGATWHSGTLPDEGWWGLVSSVAHAEPGLVIARAGSRWYRSADQGATWTRMLGPDPHELTGREDVDLPVFADALHGFVAQASRTFLRTDDGGRSWRREVDDDRSHQRLPETRFMTPLLGVAAGQSHPVRTRDGGRTWSEIDVATQDTSIRQVCFLDERIGWIVNFYGRILATTDGGRHWDKGDGSLAGSRDLQFRDARLGLAVSQDDIQRSTDGGAHWQVVWSAEPYAARQLGALDPQAVRWFGAHDAVAPSRHGVLVSHDDGLTWRAVPLPTAGPLFDAAFTDARHGWMVGDGGRIFSTDDAGDTWTREDAGVARPLRRVVFVDANHGWITAGDGVLLATTTGGH